MDAVESEHFIMFITKVHRVASRRLLTTLHETVEHLSGALGVVQRPEKEVHRDGVELCILRKRKSVEGGGGFFLRDVVCFVIGTSVQGS